MPTTPRPQLVLRIGLVGTRHLTSVPAVLASLERSVELVVEAACDELAATHRSGAYSGDAPLLRMVSGLAEGSDALGTRVFERTCSRMTSSFGIRHETAAILPFDIASYRTSRGESFRADFDELLSRCAYALTITGEWARGADDRTARARESKAHRAQSQLLLRQVDIVLAIADPMAEAKAGGTIETVREALAGGLTVLFIDALHGAIRHLRHADELVSVDLATSKATSVDRPLIGQAIRSIIGPPGRESKSAADRGSLLLDEYFGPHDPTAARTNISRLRAAAWNAARSPLKPAGTTVAGVEEDGRHVAAWRDRANALCNWYTDEYRGAFSLNYIVAVIAVLLAAVAVLTVGFSAGAHGAHAPTEGDGHSITIPLILAMLGAAKLVLLLLISTNTRDARAGKWNRRAVNYRYFLERLRSLDYLPALGCFRPPHAAAPQFASRAASQSEMEWLFSAIVRSLSPRDLLKTEGPADGTPVLLSIAPESGLMRIRDRWIASQSAYHWGTARKYEHWSQTTQETIEHLNWVVVGLVVIDLALVAMEFWHPLPTPLLVTAIILSIACVLIPAAVAALHGFRAQSECERLGDRSAVMRALLDRSPKGDEMAHPPASWGEDRMVQLDALLARMKEQRAHGAWELEALRFAVATARDFTEEAAGWSVLYAKEVTEP